MSSIKQPETTKTLIESEVQKGFVIGPFNNIPFENFRISPIGIAEGKYSGKKRLIVDLSAPHENETHPSLNDLVDKEEFSLSYVTIDNAIDIIKRLGKGSWLCKTDIQDAFKLVPIREDLWPFYGIKWDNGYYFYKRLVFGSRSSPKIFDTLSTAICWILEHNYGIHNILHLLDDFLTIDTPDSLPHRTMAILTQVFKQLGVPLSSKKTEGPTTCLEYLGIILDTKQMQARLPAEKIDRIADIISSFMVRKSCTKRELLSLLGHLNFACRVVHPGRSFISYLLTLSTSVTALHHHVHFTAECRSDLSMWLKFLKDWNGVSLFLQSDFTKAADMEFFTDATPSGFGGYFAGHWFNGKFPQHFIPKGTVSSMALCELYPIVVAAVLWGHMWSQKQIIVNCDNAATVDIINKGRSKIPFIMKFVRRLVYCTMVNNFTLRAKHIAGKTNLIADALSRFQEWKFRHLAPHADPHPTPCPPVSELTLF